jgi:hypothetical protein
MSKIRASTLLFYLSQDHIAIGKLLVLRTRLETLKSQRNHKQIKQNYDQLIQKQVMGKDLQWAFVKNNIGPQLSRPHAYFIEHLPCEKKIRDSDPACCTNQPQQPQNTTQLKNRNTQAEQICGGWLTSRNTKTETCS